MLLKYPEYARDVVGPVKKLRSSKRVYKPNILYIWGPTGIGKSFTTSSTLKHVGVSVYDKDPNHRWFPDYDQEDVVLMEEFQSCLPLTTFLKIADGRPLKVETKGGHTEFNSPYIIITSNLSAKEQYARCKYVNNPHKEEDLPSVSKGQTRIQQDKGPTTSIWDAYRRRIEDRWNFCPLDGGLADPGCTPYSYKQFENEPHVRDIVHKRISEKILEFLDQPLELFHEEEAPDGLEQKILKAKERVEENKRLMGQKEETLESDQEDVGVQDCE